MEEPDYSQMTYEEGESNRRIFFLVRETSEALGMKPFAILSAVPEVKSHRMRLDLLSEICSLSVLGYCR